MKVIAYKVGEEPTMQEIPNTLKGMQSFVGGYIEVLHVTDELVLVCNEEGKIDELPPNRTVYTQDTHQYRDCIAGDFFICRENGDEFTDALEEDIEKLGGVIQ